ncbi:MAG: hypothetical protein AAF915_23265 [Cyanobacteria bacterium P01_D01_bin.50]
MNNLVLGLLTNVLATSLLFATNVLVDSAFAAQGVDESDNNQSSVTESPQTGIFSNLDKATESTEFVNFKSVTDQNLAQEVQAKLTLNNQAEVSSPEAKAVVVFSDKTASENETDRATLSEYPAAEDNFVLAQESVVANNCCVNRSKPDLEEVKEVQRQLRDLDKIKLDSFYSSPGMSIYIPVGYGADRNTGFVAGDYQERTRFTDSDDGEMVFGVGLGDAKKSVGVVLSYTVANFGGSGDFGIGGFNVKLHRQIKDDLAVAVGMNGFLNIGSYPDPRPTNDFKNSLYGVVTKVIRTNENINKPFSRIAVTAGVGNGQFRTEDSINNDEDNFNVFGNVAVRVHPQASLITEWTGQDLAIGASIAPFKNIPFVITPAVRDIAGPGSGANDGARFVMGAGFGFKF